MRFKAGQVHYQGVIISLWDSYGLSQYALGGGSFSEDARGRWYLNIQVKVPELCGPTLSAPTGSVGIDLGLKDFFATSDGDKVAGHRFYRDLEPALASAQRARKKSRVRAIHAKIKARRQEALHQLSTHLVNQYGAIFVGNANAPKLAKTRMAKSVLDAGWGMFRSMVLYKSDRAGVMFEEVNEAYSTQTCSCCGSRTGPKGITGLGMREWTCMECGTHHDRDVNAARNILAAGHGRLAGGISSPSGD